MIRNSAKTSPCLAPASRTLPLLLCADRQPDESRWLALLGCDTFQPSSHPASLPAMKSQWLRIGLYPRWCPLALGVEKRMGRVGGPRKLQVAFEVRAGTECDCLVFRLKISFSFPACDLPGVFVLYLPALDIYSWPVAFLDCGGTVSFFAARFDMHGTPNYLR